MVNLTRPSWYRATDFTHVAPFSVPVCPTPEISPPKLGAVLLTSLPSAATTIRGSGVWQDAAVSASITTSQGYHVTAAKLADFGKKHLDGQVGAPSSADFYRILQEIDPLLLDKLPMPRQDFKIPLHRMRYILNILARDDRMLAQFKTTARQTTPGYARKIDAAQLEEELVLACASCFGGNASYTLSHTLEEITEDSSYFPDVEGFIPREQAEALADLALEAVSTRRKY